MSLCYISGLNCGIEVDNIAISWARSWLQGVPSIERLTARARKVKPALTKNNNREGYLVLLMKSILAPQSFKKIIL